MTIEEKAELLKAMGVNLGKTEIVLEKHVEYEIGNVEQGGIGVQVNNTLPAMPQNRQNSSSAAKPQGKAAARPRQVDEVFTYRHLDSEEGKRRLAKLYLMLLKAEWIAKDTKPDDFTDIFCGKPKSVKVKWTGKQAYLYALINTLVDRQLIASLEGATKWVITGSHFLDSNSRPFKDWNKQHNPATAMLAIERMADLLDITKEEEA